MLIIAFGFMFVGLGSVAMWLHLFLCEKEGHQNFFEKRYDDKGYQDFVRILSIVTAVVGTIVFAFLWYLVPVVWYGSYWLFNRFKKGA